MAKKTEKPLRISETTRTVLLLVLLAAGILFLIWTQNQYDSNFTDSF